MPPQAAERCFRFPPILNFSFPLDNTLHSQHINCTNTNNTVRRCTVLIQLNYRDPTPIYQQIKDGIRRLIATGVIQGAARSVKSCQLYGRWHPNWPSTPTPFSAPITNWRQRKSFSPFQAKDRLQLKKRIETRCARQNCFSSSRHYCMSCAVSA